MDHCFFVRLFLGHTDAMAVLAAQPPTPLPPSLEYERFKARHFLPMCRRIQLVCHGSDLVVNRSAPTYNVPQQIASLLPFLTHQPVLYAPRLATLIYQGWRRIYADGSWFTLDRIFATLAARPGGQTQWTAAQCHRWELQTGTHEKDGGSMDDWRGGRCDQCRVHDEEDIGDVWPAGEWRFWHCPGCDINRCAEHVGRPADGFCLHVLEPGGGWF